MQSLIRRDEEATIDMKRLSRLLPQKCRVVQYDHLKGKKTFKDVMMGDDCVIILWNLHDQKHRTLNQAGHFFCVWVACRDHVVSFV